MKTIIKNKIKTIKLIKIQIIKVLLVFVILTLSISSCRIEVDGRPGRAYLSLEWNGYKPTFVDAGTSAIPEYFDYGRFYRIQPGYYNIYYEGTDYYYSTPRNYAWDMDYEIFLNEGRPNGYNGDDVYFTIELNPWGPESFFTDKKQNDLILGYKIIEKNDKIIILERSVDDYGIRIKYTKIWHN